ncbi:MAG: glycosyltransferase [Armatimonadota bacterium]
MGLDVGRQPVQDPDGVLQRPEGPVVVAHVLGGQERGGIMTHVLSLARQLDPARFALRSVVFRRGLETQLSEAGIATELIPKRGRSDATFLLRLAQHLRQMRPAIVHTHSVTSNLYGRVAARLARVPVVITTAHGFVGDILRQNPSVPRLAAGPLALLDLKMSRLSDRLITVSESIAADLVARGVRREKVIAIPNGVEVSRFRLGLEARAAMRKALGVAPTEPLIGTVGSLIPLRNHALFLSAARRVLAEVPQARFAVVGDGSEGPRLRELAKELGIADRVIFTGERRDVPEVLSAFDIFALSCDTEGFGLAALEAMAAGLPIVATRVGALPELIEGEVSGVLVPPGDAPALADALLRLLRESETARRLGQAARARAEASYSVERTAQQLSELYLEVLERRGARRTGAPPGVGPRR